MEGITEYKCICLICGAMATETHHLLYGRGIRPLAEEDGITARLCASCHMNIHHISGMGTMSKIIGQLQWEKNKIEMGRNPERVRSEFRDRYGRSWL